MEKLILFAILVDYVLGYFPGMSKIVYILFYLVHEKKSEY